MINIIITHLSSQKMNHLLGFDLLHAYVEVSSANRHPTMALCKVDEELVAVVDVRREGERHGYVWDEWGDCWDVVGDVVVDDDGGDGNTKGIPQWRD